MEEPRRRGGGGGGAAAVSKNAPSPARHAGGAFGAPQRRFAPAHLDDYAEIFGDLAGSCSIPFLDLQPPLDGFAPPAAGFDYSELFGGLDFGEFAAPCEELCAPASRREAAAAPPSANGRTVEETTSSQQTSVELNFSTKHSNGGHMENREADWSSTNSNCSDNGSMRSNVSHNKNTKKSKGATMNGNTNAAQLTDIPASSSIIDTPNSIQNTGGDGPHDMLNEGIGIWEQQNRISVTSTDNSKCVENSVHADKNKIFDPVPKDGRAKASYPSRFSSRSISSGDASSINVSYVTVSDISLCTQPLGVPPPSRPPPRSYDKWRNPKPRILSSPIVCTDEVRLSKSVSKDHVHQEVVKENSPSFFDVEITVSSAAAASAAAIKDAMELAQAKLKSAKQLMERKRDSLQNSKKMGNQESAKRKEEKLDHASIGRESFEECLAFSQKINEATGAAKLTQHCKVKETVEVLTKENEQPKQRNDLKPYKVSKSADKSEKWETNRVYHELVNSDKYEMTFEREGPIKTAKLMTTACEGKQNDTLKDTLVYEIESNRNLRKESLVAAPSVHEENADLEADGSHVEEVGKLKQTDNFHGQVRETEALAFVGGDEKMKPYVCSKIRFTFADNIGKSKAEDAVLTCEDENSSNFVEIDTSKGSKEEEGKSEAVKCHGEKIQKEINIPNKVSNSSNDEGKFHMTYTTVAEEKLGGQVPQRSCIANVEGNEGACTGMNTEKTLIEEKQCDAHVVEEPEGTEAIREMEKKEIPNMKQQSCLSLENELKYKVDEETTKHQEVINEWKSSEGATTLIERAELMKAAKVVCWQDCNRDNTKEAQLILQHRDTGEDEFPESYNQQNFEGQKLCVIELWGSGNEGIVEMQVGRDLMDKIISIDAVISRRPLDTALDFQPTNLSWEGGNLSIVSMKRHPVISQNFISEIKKAGEQEILGVQMEKKQMEKQKRRLEEEKEEEKFQEENKVNKSMLEETEEIQGKLEEDMERARLFDGLKERDRKMEEEREQALLLEEAKERGKKMNEEREQTRLLEEAIERERKFKEEKEWAMLVEEAKERERTLQEEKEQARLLEEAKEKKRKLKEEKEQAMLIEAKEREGKLNEEKGQAMLLLEETKEREKKLEEEKEKARLLEKTKEREKKIVDEQSKFSEESSRKGRKLEEEKDRVRLSEEGKINEQKSEEERAKLLEKIKEREKKQHEKEREREREKDRAAVERATREAHERAFVEARERAERIAVERVKSEVWQRALKDAQEKAEKASLESHEKSLNDKVAREARLRAERAAVERATAEARERAVERALAGKAAADAREHAERNNGTLRDRTRKDTVTEVHLKAKDTDRPYGQLHGSGAPTSNQANYDSNDLCEGESILRCKARLERHQRIAERAAKALAEKNTRDILAQREQAERDRLSEFLDADVKRWSNGKEGNLRSLLSTLQYILGPESGWQPIPLTDVITAAAVKKAYRKATLWVHPDKLQQRGASIQQKYVCEKVFDLLKEAWNRFNSEER